MNLASPRVVLGFTLLLSPALLPLLGCGRAEYEEQVQKAIARLKLDNQFKTLEAMPSVLAAFKNERSPSGTKVTFRKPQLYSNVPTFNETTTNPRNQAEPMKPERLKPPFLQNFPGYANTWERAPVSGRNDSVAVLYTGAQVSDPTLMQQILDQVKAAYPDLPAELAWSEIAVQMPEQGKTAKWSILSFEHEQDFWHTSDVDPIKVKGTVVVLVREEQGRQVIVLSRWSDTAGDLHQRRQEVLSAAGTVQVALGAKID